MPTGDLDTAVELPTGTAIITVDETDGSKQLVAVVEGVSNFSLTQNYVEFI
jgi:hypothetical protein